MFCSFFLLYWFGTYIVFYCIFTFNIKNYKTKAGVFLYYLWKEFVRIKTNIVVFKKALQIKFGLPLTVDNTPRITLSMVVRNEADKFLRKMLLACIEYVDDVLIIDDASTDNTVILCEELLHDVPHVIVKNKQSLFANEYILREQQWKETIKLDPEWILFLDADEIFEPCFKDQIREVLLSDPGIDVYKFRLFDRWNELEYRSDDLWNAHLRYVPFIVRYRKEIPYLFEKKVQHCGRIPWNVKYMKSQKSELRLQHLGWMLPEIREHKYNRYMQLDPDGVCGDIEQYKSILDKHPTLEKW